jgi:hypothetical protein
MRSWLAAGLGTVLAVILPATNVPADSTACVATETTSVADATTQIYSWSFVGPTDCTLVDTFSFGPPIGSFDFFLTNDVLSGVPGHNILGILFPDDGTVFDPLMILTGGESPLSGCSLSDFPLCQPGVVNAYLATIDWSLLPEEPGGELEAGAFNFSITPISRPEPGTLLLLGTGLIGVSCLGKWKRWRTRRFPRP